MLRNVLALDVRHLELGIVTALTAALAFASPRATSGSAPGMPAPSPEPVSVRQTATSAIACDDPGIQTIVFTGHVHSADPALTTLHFQFAELPDGYSVMTGANGAFEVHVPRAELRVADLCSLPTSTLHSASFSDSQLSIEYVLQFER